MSFPCRTWHTDSDPKDSATQRALRLEERNCRIPDFDGSTSEYTAFSGRNGSDQYAGPCPAVRRCVETTATIVGWADVECRVMRGDAIVEQRTRPGRSSTRTSTSRQNSVRCGVPYIRLRAAAVRRDGRRRREGGPRVPRDGRACRREVLGVSRARGRVRDGVDWRTGAEGFDAADWSTHVGGASEQRRPRTVGFLRNIDRRARGRRRRLDSPPARLRR